MSAPVTVSEEGSIVIPEEIRERFGIKKGDKIHFLDWGGQIVLVPIPPGDPIERGLGLLKGGPSLTKELLEERRRENEREERRMPPPRPRG